MECPMCRTELVPGRLVCKTRFWTTVATPFFDDKKWHFKDASGKRLRLQSSLNKAEVLRCPECGCMVVPAGAA